MKTILNIQLIDMGPNGAEPLTLQRLSQIFEASGYRVEVCIGIDSIPKTTLLLTKENKENYDDIPF